MLTSQNVSTMRIRFAVLALGLSLAACAGAQKAVVTPLAGVPSGADAESLRKAADELWEQRLDEKSLREAIGLYEQLYALEPANPALLDRLTRAYYLVGYAYTEDAEGKIAAHDRGRQFGLKRLELHSGYKEVVDGGGSMQDAVARIDDPAYVHALLFTSSNWGWWAEQKGISKVAFDIPKVKALFLRAMALDETYLCGGPKLMAAAFYAKAGAFGGDMELARKFYEDVTQDATCLDNKVLYARFYAIPLDDQLLFHRLLTEVVEAEADPALDHKLENAVAKRNAAALLAQENDLF